MRWLLRNYKKTLSMRKMIILLVCALLSVNAFAQNPLMTIKSGSLDVFNESVNINYKAGGAHISGNMLLVDNAAKKVICEMSFKRVKGVRSPVFSARAISMYGYLADGLLRNIRKSNKN